MAARRKRIFFLKFLNYYRDNKYLLNAYFMACSKVFFNGY